MMDGSEFLAELQSVQHGLSQRDITNQQLTCYFFLDGFVYTYNEDCICRRRSVLPPEVIGNGLAIQSAPLLAMAGKFGGEQVQISLEGNHLVFKAKRRRGGVLLEEEVLTKPSEFLSLPKKSDWKPIPPDLPLAVERVATTASRNGTNHYALMCVHLTPKYIEASDAYQASRYRLKLPISESLIIRHETISGVVNLGATDMAVDENWVYFRNRKKVVMAYSRYVEQAFPKLDGALNAKGKPIKLPENMDAVLDKATVMLDDVKDQQLDVKLTPGVCTIHGQGARGWYTEKIKVEYTGPSIAFQIAPAMLEAICGDDMHCEVECESVNAFIKAVSDDGKFTYVASLDQPAETAAATSAEDE